MGCPTYTKNMAHGDIKPENLLLTEKLQVKITNFGASKFSVANFFQKVS